MKVANITSRTGNIIANQFIIICDNDKYFQSYSSTIIKIKNYYNNSKPNQVYLDKTYWDYSNTTGKYRNIFLEESKKDTEKKIKSGEYILTDLN